MAGTLLISLDFELFWGMHDTSTIEEYGTHILGGRKAIPQILERFERYGIHATWATVGGILAEDEKEFLSYAPPEEKRPHYAEEKLSSYRCAPDRLKKPQYFFASELAERIAETAGQRIGSHTFSHYYCREAGQTVEEFEADLQAARRIMRAKGYEADSVILPKNQCEKEHVEKLSRNGFKVYRGEEQDWIHRMKYGTAMRGLRLLDSYVSLTGPQCYTAEEAKEGKVYNFRGSRFLRPYNRKLAFLEKLKIRRLKRQMEYAARHSLIFHMWWHPHNFGEDQSENFRNLDEILEFFSMMREKYGMRSMNMEELAEEADR